MPCPHAEVSRGVVRCRLVGDHVNPFIYPCLGFYRGCPRFRKAKEVRAKTVAVPEPSNLIREENFDYKLSESITGLFYLSNVYVKYRLYAFKEAGVDELLRYINSTVRKVKFEDILVSIKISEEFSVALRITPNLKFGAALVGKGEIRAIKSFSELMELLSDRSVEASIYLL